MASVFWDVQGILFIDYLETHQYRVLLWIIGAMAKGNCKDQASNEEEKTALAPRQCTMHKLMKMMDKLN